MSAASRVGLGGARADPPSRTGDRNSLDGGAEGGWAGLTEGHPDQVNGNGAAGGGAPAGGGGKGGWWGKWDAKAREVLAGTGGKVGQAWDAGVNLVKDPKMNVKVDVDMIKPTIETVKKTSLEFWMSVPPEARKALPFAGTALLSSLATSKAVGGWMKRKAAKAAAGYQDEIDRLVLEKDNFKERCKRLESMPTQNDAQMAAAVAQATQAAAAAAVAAAEAASRCPLRAQRSLAHSGK